MVVVVGVDGVVVTGVVDVPELDGAPAPVPATVPCGISSIV